MKTKTIYYCIFIILFFQNIFAQQDGYWDKDRSTTKQIVVSAYDRFIIKSEDFPIGTTEILYRITLLDDNQQLSSSLVSLLKSVPDPSGISQGSAGAVFVLSKIAGDDKCKYAIFSTENFAKTYQTSGSTSQSCLVQNEPVSKDAKLLTVNKSICIKEQTQNIWFGFESKNWIMNQKIILEIVPWVDNKLSRGWNETNKKNANTAIKKADLDIKFINSDLYVISILEIIQKNYTFSEFQHLSPTELSKIVNDFGTQVINEANIDAKLINNIRKDAWQYFRNNQYEEAILLLEQTLINKKQVKATDFNQIGYFYLYTNQYQKALQYLQKGQKIDDADLAIKLNLAHTYLLLDDFGKAKTIYKQYQNQNINAKISWKDKLKQDFMNFKKAGINNNNFEKILNKLD